MDNCLLTRKLLDETVEYSTFNGFSQGFVYFCIVYKSLVLFHVNWTRNTFFRFLRVFYMNK